MGVFDIFKKLGGKKYYCQACGKGVNSLSTINNCQYAFCSKGCENQFGHDLTDLMYQGKPHKSRCRNCGATMMVRNNDFSPADYKCSQCGKGNT